MFKQLETSPILPRVVPFAVFIILTFCQDQFGEAGRYWIYLGKTLAGGWLVWSVRAFIAELRWALSWEAMLVGIGVFVMWVGLDDLLVKLGLPNSYPKLKMSAAAWNPTAAFGQGSLLAWFFIVVRVIGSTLIVPPLEEVFFRSFVYRYLIRADFLSVPLGQFALRPFVITALVFGFEHREWLAGILCGFAYQGLVLRKQRLGDAITAHAVTNLLLGLWVVGKPAWHFW